MCTVYERVPVMIVHEEIHRVCIIYERVQVLQRAYQCCTEQRLFRVLYMIKDCSHYSCVVYEQRLLTLFVCSV